MIKSALIALGLSAGAAQGQGFASTVPLLESCGGTRLVLEDVTLIDGTHSHEDMMTAENVINGRFGARYGSIFSYAQMTDDGQIVVSLPFVYDVDFQQRPRLFEQLTFGFYEVIAATQNETDPPLEQGQIILPQRDDPFLRYILEIEPLIDGNGFADAQQAFDQNNQPAITFRFTPEAGRTFEEYSGENIGRPFAIVLNDDVISAPRIHSVITDGSGIVSGNFTIDEVTELAAAMRSGALPFDLFLVFQETVDGSDPSADFCP